MDGDPGMTSMLLSRLHYPVSNLGFGTRAGVWFQGCTIGCRGCLARDTWASDEATRCDVRRVLEWLRRTPGPLDGVTISGGEPTDQPEALRALLAGIKLRNAETGAPLDVLLFSGRSAKWLRAKCAWVFDAVDVLVSEPFVAAKAGCEPLRGSSNQHVHVLTDLGRERYLGPDFTSYAVQRRELGVHVDSGTVRLVGIPLPGHMAALTAALSEQDIELDDASWLT